MVRRHFPALLLILVVSIAVTWFARQPNGNALKSVRMSRTLMGTFWTIEVLDNRPDRRAVESAVNRAFDEVSRIESVLSEWQPDSPVSQVNAAAGKMPVSVPNELIEILTRTLEYGRETNGAFDVTWRGLGNIWRFDDRFIVPTAAAVAQARRNVNYRDLEIKGGTVFLRRREMSIGLGGVGKGYAVDRVAALLRVGGFKDFMVAGAGDILVSGKKAGESWRLGVQDPRRERGAMLGAVTISNAAISTSGDYERFRDVDGVRYHHIIDARTGWPARLCRTVSVVAPSAETSDVLATAIFILGPVDGLALAKSKGVDILIIDSAGNRHATGVFLKMR